MIEISLSTVDIWMGIINVWGYDRDFIVHLCLRLPVQYRHNSMTYTFPIIYVHTVVIYVFLDTSVNCSCTDWSMCPMYFTIPNTHEVVI